MNILSVQCDSFPDGLADVHKDFIKDSDLKGIVDIYYSSVLTDFNNNSDIISVLSHDDHLNNGSFSDSDVTNKSVFLCAPLNNKPEKVHHLLYVKEENRHYVPFLELSFSFYSQDDNSEDRKSTNTFDPIGIIEKTVTVFDKLFRHYDNGIFNMKNLVSPIMFFHLDSEVNEVTYSVDKYPFLHTSNQKQVFGSSDYCYHYINLLYDKIMSIENMTDNNQINDSYDCALISILIFQKDVNSGIKYLYNPSNNMANRPMNVLEQTMNRLEDKNIIDSYFLSNDFFYQLYIDNDVYDKLSKNVDNIHQSLKKVAISNLNSHAKKTLDYYYAFEEIAKSTGEHSEQVLNETKKRISYEKRINKLNSSIMYTWSSIVMYPHCASDDRSAFVKTINSSPDTHIDTLKFLYSKDVMEYYNEYEIGNDNAVQMIKKDLNDMMIGGNSTQSHVNERFYCLEFFMPFLIRKANDYFHHNLDTELMKKYYQHYVDNKPYSTNNDDEYDFIFTNKLINYTIMPFIHDKQKVNNFIFAYPYIIDYVYDCNNPDTICSLIKNIMHSDHNTIVKFINDEIKVDHFTVK